MRRVRADGVVLTIQDNGVGIAADGLPKVFDAFFTTRSTVGTGIGLIRCEAVCRRPRWPN